MFVVLSNRCEDEGGVMKIALKCALLAALTFFLANQTFANPCPPGNPPTNCAPPPGAILDLHGTPIPHTYTILC